MAANETRTESKTESKTGGGSTSVALSLLVLALAFAIFTTAQTVSLLRDRSLLQAGIAAQESPLVNAQRMRAQMEAIVSETARLAGAGNPNARRVIDEFRRRGINLSPAGAGS